MISDFGKLTSFERGALLTKWLICLILVNVVIWGSKPTGWDGDLQRDCKGNCKDFSSKPTGWDGDQCSYRRASEQYLGPEPTVWDGDCGVIIRWISFAMSSEPTVWDGDHVHIICSFPFIEIVPSPPCGMVTWKGEEWVAGCMRLSVLSPLCGMETPYLLTQSPEHLKASSEPTAWDGDSW